MTQARLPMPLPVATSPGTCGSDAIVLWHIKDGGTVCACEPHRMEMVPEGRFIDFVLLGPGKAKCDWREEACDRS